MKPSEQTRARELYAAGVSRQEISIELGVSRSAVTDWTRKMPVPEKLCVVCNKPFHPKRTNQRYCSDKCSKRQDYQTRKPSPPPARLCEECDKSFQPLDGRHRFCSVKCGSKARSRRHYQARKTMTSKE